MPLDAHTYIVLIINFTNKCIKYWTYRPFFLATHFARHRCCILQSNLWNWTRIHAERPEFFDYLLSFTTAFHETPNFLYCPSHHASIHQVLSTIPKFPAITRRFLKMKQSCYLFSLLHADFFCGSKLLVVLLWVWMSDYKPVNCLSRHTGPSTFLYVTPPALHIQSQWRSLSHHSKLNRCKWPY